MSKFQYTKLDDQAIKAIQGLQNVSQDIEVVSTTIQLADMEGEFYEERPAKTFNELVADIGGSLGVVLGLSLIDVLVFGRWLTNFIKRRVATYKRDYETIKKLLTPDRNTIRNIKV